MSELGLTLTVTLVCSAANHADVLSRVPSGWVRSDSDHVAAASSLDGEPARVCSDSAPAAPETVTDHVAAAGSLDSGPAQVTSVSNDNGLMSAIADVHARAGHPGVRRTLYFARRDVSSAIRRAQVRHVVMTCDVCRAVDPAPVKWRHGSLGVPETWNRLAIDITHYRGQSFLSIIDCGPSRFCLWRQLRRSDSGSVIAQLEQVFLERGAPVEILADNDTAFRS